MIYETKKCISEKVKVLCLKHIFAKSFLMQLYYESRQQNCSFSRKTNPSCMA